MTQPLICPHCKVVFGNTLVVTEGQIVTCHHCGGRNEIHFEERRLQPRNLFDSSPHTNELLQHVVVKPIKSVDTPFK